MSNAQIASMRCGAHRNGMTEQVVVVVNTARLFGHFRNHSFARELYEITIAFSKSGGSNADIGCPHEVRWCHHRHDTTTNREDPSYNLLNLLLQPHSCAWLLCG